MVLNLLLVLQFAVYVNEESRTQMEVTGSQLHIDFTISDPATSQTDKKVSAYTLRVRLVLTC